MKSTWCDVLNVLDVEENPHFVAQVLILMGVIGKLSFSTKPGFEFWKEVPGFGNKSAAFVGFFLPLFPHNLACFARMQQFTVTVPQH